MILKKGLASALILSGLIGCGNNEPVSRVQLDNSIGYWSKAEEYDYGKDETNFRKVSAAINTESAKYADEKVIPISDNLRVSLNYINENFKYNHQFYNGEDARGLFTFLTDGTLDSRDSITRKEFMIAGESLTHNVNHIFSNSEFSEYTEALQNYNQSEAEFAKVLKKDIEENHPELVSPLTLLNNNSNFLDDLIHGNLRINGVTNKHRYERIENYLEDAWNRAEIVDGPYVIGFVGTTGKKRMDDMKIALDDIVKSHPDVYFDLEVKNWENRNIFYIPSMSGSTGLGSFLDSWVTQPAYFVVNDGTNGVDSNKVIAYDFVSARDLLNRELKKIEK